MPKIHFPLPLGSQWIVPLGLAAALTLLFVWYRLGCRRRPRHWREQSQVPSRPARVLLTGRA